MKCRTCGNEVSSEEAFCGQCGTPVAASQARQPEMIPPLRSGRLNGYAPQENFGQQNNSPRGTQPLGVQGVSLPPSASQQQSPTPQIPSGQSTGFYRDATEAIPLVPRNPNAGYQQPYPARQQSNIFPPQSMPTSYGFSSQASQQQGQPLQTGNYAGQGHPQQQGYRAVPTPPRRQRNGAIIFIVSMCLVVALLSVVGVGTLYVLRGRNVGLQSTPTAGIVSTATTIPTGVPTSTPTTMPTETPTATLTPTAAPVGGFAYCGTLCTNYGFSTQYPQTWAASPFTGGQGVQFENVNPNDQIAIFKTPGGTSSSASDLLANELQQNFQTKDNYQVVSPVSAESIGGETWLKEVITYQNDGQPKERVEVYATAHQGKAYILDLQASDDQFDSVGGQYFTTIKGQFQFQ